jgi:3-oxoacyl-[acyl-carrier-protein] synthase III
MNTYQFPESKKYSWTRPCKIISMASVLPESKLTNKQISLHQQNPLPEGMINKMIGVQNRHVASAGSSDSDLLMEAALECLKNAGVNIEDVSKLIVNKFLGDRILPPTASILQRKLGSRKAIQCMDIDGGMNSFMQSFIMAAKCIQSGDDYILIVSGGICHDLISKDNPRVSYLFGDGATAILLGRSEASHILSYYEFSNYEYSQIFQSTDFFSAAKIRPEALTSDPLLHDMYRMENWKDANDFILKAMKHTADCLLESADCSFGNIDYFLVSEINQPLWENIIKHLNIQIGRTISLLQQQGNTLTANMPMLLVNLNKKVSLQPGQKVMMLSVGEGLCGGGCIYQK